MPLGWTVTKAEEDSCGNGSLRAPQPASINVTMLSATVEARKADFFIPMPLSRASLSAFNLFMFGIADFLTLRFSTWSVF
ncbi:hypothetical protein GCM10027027_19070 [Neomicrococcus lactis]